MKSLDHGGFLKPDTTYYCVKWTDVLDLVRYRKVILENGTAFVAANDLISVLGTVFRSNLSHNLAVIGHLFFFFFH